MADPEKFRPLDPRLLELLHLSEWEKRAKRPGYQAVMSTRWTPEECERGTEKLKEVTFSFLGNLSAVTIVDIGCGIGRFSGELARKGKKVYAVDISHSMLRRAKEAITVGNVYFLLASALELPLRENIADLTFGVTVLEHLVDDELFRATIEEIKRITHLDGTIFLCGEISNQYRLISPFTVLRTIDEYKHALEPWKLIKTEKHKCVTDIYTLMLWKKEN